MKRKFFFSMLFLVILKSLLVVSNAAGGIDFYLIVEPQTESEMHIRLRSICSAYCRPWDDQFRMREWWLYRGYYQIFHSIYSQYWDQNLSPNTTYCYSARVIRNNGEGVLLGPICETTFAYYITLNKDNGGYISPWNNGKIYVYAGAEQPFSIYPYEGFRLKDVLVDGKSVGPVNSYTFTNITENHTLEAKFQKLGKLNHLLPLLLSE